MLPLHPLCALPTTPATFLRRRRRGRDLPICFRSDKDGFDDFDDDGDDSFSPAPGPPAWARVAVPAIVDGQAEEVDILVLAGVAASAALVPDDRLFALSALLLLVTAVLSDAPQWAALGAATLVSGILETNGGAGVHAVVALSVAVISSGIMVDVDPLGYVASALSPGEEELARWDRKLRSKDMSKGKAPGGVRGGSEKSKSDPD